ncbi:CBS domain containing-hemolysin-like protein [Caldalkalibacillus uzonensis]|uniref:CBS domain containing-hemolysin-like protein n=1 Tax=Caldalkalibacillus uzonensis TaxID=353224 RepID=A0ABU0CXI0_9BACI|nr:hemolysin family protein [Caldalkalibacillus uzonensis]MDQ0340909.1 CBS domain containing-hemolysin-like protein [Caldalkalibacillus uzonensis]
MDEVPLSFLFLLLILLALSAFFSSTETAFSSVSKIRLKHFADEKRKGAQKALYISEHFDKALTTILVGNNLVNIAAATIASSLFVTMFGTKSGMLLSTIVMTILVLIFGEILPKSFAKEHADSFSLAVSSILFLLMKLFAPINWLFAQLKRTLVKIIHPKQHIPSVTEEEIKIMVDISEEEGVIDKTEKELVHRSLNFNDIIVGEILTPRPDMIAVEVSQPIEEIKQVFLREKFSRIPVYEDSIDNIIGILSEREFLSALLQNQDVDVRSLLRNPLFVVESMRISSLLPELQRHKIHMAIVIDEFGGTSGLITMEDVLEELVGEIWDEHDEQVKVINQLDENTYIFSADFSLDEFARMTKVELPDSVYHTIGGWLVEEFQRVPQKGEQLYYENLLLTIEEAESRRVRKVRAEIKKFSNSESKAYV